MIPRERTTDIIVHGAFTPASMDVGVEEIREWHLDRDFEDIGYHYVIRRDGTLEAGRHADLMGAHTRGSNAFSIGICLVGGMAGDPPNQRWEFNYTYRQLVTLGGIIGRLMFDYPDITTVKGHRDYPNVHKDCPGFDVEALVGREARLLR